MSNTTFVPSRSFLAYQVDRVVLVCCSFHKTGWKPILITTGFPLLSHFTEKKQTKQGGFNLGGINATGQIAEIPGNWGLIDHDTPASAYTKKSYVDPSEDLVLVFSDEFETDGRTFYPGDDPYWEAVNLHYWGTVRGLCGRLWSPG